MLKITEYIRLIRIRHYIKNVLIFAALVCSGQLFNIDKFWAGMVGFLSFCAISSVVYIINDIQDEDKDSQHPIKCKRPIASGKISKKNAGFLAVVLLLIAIICNFFVFRIVSTSLLILYLFLNLLYSMGLKNVPLVDVTILVLGFLLRVVYGAIITEITISNWLYIMVIMLAFYFSFGKRRNELKREGTMGETRKVLKFYPMNFLDKNMYMCLTIAIVCYILWCMDDNTVLRYGGISLVFTTPIILLIIMKYSMDIEGDFDGDPVEVLMHDKVLLLMCVMYFLLMFVVLYF